MMEDIYCSIEKIVRQAGEILQSAHLNQNEIFEKEGPANFVTVYDKKIQQFLIKELKQILPEAAFFGEEDTDGNGCRNVFKRYVFFIDPIDGTTNFLFDYRQSCISVGLSQDGHMIAGFVFDPYSNRMYKGIRGKGAYLNDKHLKIEDKALSEGIAEFGCARYNVEHVDLMMNVVKELFLRSICIRNGGSAAIGISKVSTGSNVLLLISRKIHTRTQTALSICMKRAAFYIDNTDNSSSCLPVADFMSCRQIAFINCRYSAQFAVIDE